MPISGLMKDTFDYLTTYGRGVRGVLTGCKVWITANGLELGHVDGAAKHQGVNVNPDYGLSQKVQGWAKMCNDPSPPSEEYTTQTAALPLPTPTIEPVYEGGQQITIDGLVNGARFQLSRNGIDKGTWRTWGVRHTVDCGESGGPVVMLTKAVHRGDTVDVLQGVGKCEAQTAQELKVLCVAPQTTYDPSILDLYPVGNANYDGGTTNILGSTYHVKGTVYYPAEEDGVSKPFNKRVAKHGPIPIVFMAHGNHDPSVPSHLGYDYFQQQLAKMGIIAVSVFSNETNGWFGGASNITTRAQLIIASIAYFQQLNSTGDPIFGGRIHLSLVGLMGHPVAARL